MLEITSLAAVKTKDEQSELSAPVQGMSAWSQASGGVRPEGRTGDTGMGGDCGRRCHIQRERGPRAAWVTPPPGVALDKREAGKEPPERPGGGAEGLLQSATWCLVLMEGWLHGLGGDMGGDSAWVEPRGPSSEARGSRR